MALGRRGIGRRPFLPTEDAEWGVAVIARQFGYEESYPRDAGV